MKNQNIIKGILLSLALTIPLMGCGQKRTDTAEQETGNTQTEIRNTISFSSNITELEKGLSMVSYQGEDYLEEFLKQGAASDKEVMQFLNQKLQGTLSSAAFEGSPYGCSTLSVEGTDGERYFGRNFDWMSCDALIVKNEPTSGYASIATVNTDFISGYKQLPDMAKTAAAVYAPLDGMNEKGLCVSVNMIQDSATIDQNSGKPGITTTTAVRMLLDRAADTKEAVALLKEHDLHASKGMMIHFAICDLSGNSIVVEYIDNEMKVTKTPVVTNFYLTEGEKFGKGTKQSHERYDILMDRIARLGTFQSEDVSNALDDVSKDNFTKLESTEWSIVFNQLTGEATYYHQEHFDQSWSFQLTKEKG